MIDNAVCAIERTLQGDNDSITKVVALAGNLENAGGRSFDAKLTRLKTAESNSDSSKEGVRVVLQGGRHPLDGPSKERRDQQVVIEFLCDQDKEGNEGEWDSEDKYERMVRREDNKDGQDDESGNDGESSIEHQLKKDNATLIWESYKQEKDIDVLRMTWHTKHACENKRDGEDDDGSSSGSWGFFTWVFLM